MTAVQRHKMYLTTRWGDEVWKSLNALERPRQNILWGPDPLQNALSDHPSVILADNADRSPARTAAVQPVHRWTGKNLEIVDATSL